MKNLRIILVLLAAMCAVGLSFKGLREPDLWWQIKTGEWILAHGAVPDQDVFSFTQKGNSWINIKWGFEVLAALVSNAAGAESVFIIQAAILLLLLYFSLKLTNEIALDFRNNGKQETAFFLLLPLLFMSIDYRINGRPEMFSHLFTIIFVWLNLKFRNQPSNTIWWLIPLQCLWANLHEAFAVGVVVNITFLIAYVIERKILKWKSFHAKNFTVYAGAVLLSITAIFLNPYGSKMLLQPFAIFNQIFENKFTTELLSITSHQYWQKEAWLGLFWVLAAMLFLVLFVLKNKKNIQKLSIGYWLLVLAFIYLATSAFRNIVFPILLLFPIVVVATSELLNPGVKLSRVATPLSAILLLLFYLSVITNYYYEKTNSRDRFGLQILPDYNPIGAANFIEQKKLSGKCFSDYLTSSYLLWKIKDFETFIDLRDLDVFPASFFNTFTEAVIFPERFNELNKQYHFDYAVLFRPQFQNLHAYLSNKNGFRLVYADAIAAVYEQSNDTSALQDVFQPIASIATGKFAKTLNQFLNPFFTPAYDFSNENNFAAASFYLTIGDFAFAEIYAQKLVAGNDAWKGYSLLGEIAYQKSFSASSDSSNILLQSAQSFFSKALQINENYVPALMGVGTIFFKQGFFTNAKTAFEKATKLESDNVSAWVSLAECYKATLQIPESLDGAIAAFEIANNLNPNNPNITLNLGVMYFRKKDCSKSVKLLQKAQNFPNLTNEEKEVVKTCLTQCGGA